MRISALLLLSWVVGGCATGLPNGEHPDLAGGDMADATPDLAALDMAYLPPDLALPPDLSFADLASPPDLTLPPDLSPPPVKPIPPKPVCGTSFSASGVPVASVSTSGAQEALLGASASGDSLLLLRASFAECVGAPDTLLTIADAATSGATNYVSQDITSAMHVDGFSGAEATMTLSADGLTIIGVANLQFRQVSRPIAGATNFGFPIIGPFAQINASLGGVTSLEWPLLSADGLAFYYHVSGGIGVGTYESLRASTSDPFPAGTFMPDAIQQFGAVTGISSDRLTLFVTADFGTSIMTRPTLADAFSLAPNQMAPGSAYRVVPIDSCYLLIGTCEPGGCANEDICLWSAAP